MVQQPDTPFDTRSFRLSRRALGALLSELAGLGVLGFLAFYYVPIYAQWASQQWAPEHVTSGTLLFVGLLLVLMPPALALRFGAVGFLAASSGALLSYVVLFVEPPASPGNSFFTYVAFLTVLFVALASILALPIGAAGRLVPGSAPSTTNELARAGRQGVLLALFAVTLLAMSPLGVLNWLNTLLVFAILALTELFFVART